MKVILPNFNNTDTIDLSGLTPEHFVVAFLNGKPFGVLLTDEDNCEYWIQSTMGCDRFTDKFTTIYEAVEDFICQFPDITFEAYL